MAPGCHAVNGGGLPSSCPIPSYATLPLRAPEMTLSVHDALIHLMVATASSDAAISESELQRIQSVIARTPVFTGFDRSQFTAVANSCIDIINGGGGLDAALDGAVAALPER